MDELQAARERLKDRVAEIGRNLDEEERRGRVVKNAAFALVGAVGALVALRRLGQGQISGGRSSRKKRKK